MQQFVFNPGDLAPGDQRSREFACEQVQVRRVSSSGDPLFEEAYARLWAQFGAADELESREVIARRLDRDPQVREDGRTLRYDLVLVQSKGGFAAVRDHTAMADSGGAVVHLSHVLVDPRWRRGGLAGWLRAFPIQTARACLRAGGFPADAPITLAGEMEYVDGADDARWIRLKAYERAGYRKIDPSVIDYHQPDFRPPAMIDAAGGPVPLRFQLIVRRVGREAETHISGAEVRAIADRLYRIYGQEFRASDMAAVWPLLEQYPAPDSRIALLPPTA